MKIERNVELPTMIRNADSNAIYEFAKSNDANLKLGYDSNKEAINGYYRAKNLIKSKGLNVKIMKRGNDIYVLHKEEK